MAVTDLHTIDVENAIKGLYTPGSAIPGAVMSLVSQTPNINVGKSVVRTMGARAKGALVHEGGAKPDNGRQVVPKPFTTVKLVYSQRVSDEFLMDDEHIQANFVSDLIKDWMQKSLPRDIDTVVLHGKDPFTDDVDSNLSDYIGKAGSHVSVPSTGTTASAYDTDMQTARMALEGQMINGVAISSDAASKLATYAENGVAKYPGLNFFGTTNGNIAGVKAASTPEVSDGGKVKMVIGDWDKLFLGFAGQATWKTIEYGDPDGTGVDLQNVNQVCIRLELHFGFRVLDPEAFAVVEYAQQSA